TGVVSYDDLSMDRNAQPLRGTGFRTQAREWLLWKALTLPDGGDPAPAESAATRERLSNELSGITSAEQLTDWTFRQLPIKNTLTADVARMVEEAFQARLAELARSDMSVADPAPSGSDKDAADSAAQSTNSSAHSAASEPA